MVREERGRAGVKVPPPAVAAAVVAAVVVAVVAGEPWMFG